MDPQFLAKHFGLNFTVNMELQFKEQLESVLWEWITSEKKHDRRRKLAKALHELSHKILLTFEDEKLAKELQNLSQVYYNTLNYL